MSVGELTKRIKNIFQKLKLAYNQNSRGWYGLQLPVKSFYVWSTADRLVLHLACLSDSLKSFNATKGSAKVIFHSSGMLSIFECLFLKLPYRSHIVECEFLFFLFFYYKVYKAGRGTLKVSKSSENALNAHSLYSEKLYQSSRELHDTPVDTAWQKWWVQHSGRSLLRPVTADQSD